jgi:DNA polymerase III epsilon subunit-like protein
MSVYAPLDTETGGLDPEIADLLTLYICIMDDNFNLLDELDLQLKPDGGRLPNADAGALRVNGINIAEHMADPKTITYSEAKPLVVAMLKKHYKKIGKSIQTRTMGHNLPFDNSFIWKYLIPKDEWTKLVHYGIIDTKSNTDFLKDAGWLPKDVGTLISLVEFFGIPKRDAHRAKGDTLMCVDVYKAQLGLMKSKKESAPQQDLISLLEQE